MATTDDQSVDGTTASDQPGGSAQTPDLDTIVQRAVAAALEQTDKRFQGFQSLVDKKLQALSNQFKTVGLSPEEREQLEAEEGEDEITTLRRKVELYENRERFPKGADLMARLMEAESLDDQLALIEQAFGPEAASQVAESVAEESTDETPVPEVDRNSPMRPLKAGGQSALSADEMSEEVADALLANAGKGSLVSSRRIG